MNASVPDGPESRPSRAANAAESSPPARVPAARPLAEVTPGLGDVMATPTSGDPPDLTPDDEYEPL
jgi:hypothetical protein